MDALILCYRGEALREFSLQGQPLEVGRGAGCDIVVHDPSVPERHLLVQAEQGGVWVFDLARKRRRRLGPNAPLAIGRHHSLVRVPDAPTRPRDLARGTEPLEGARAGGQRPENALVIGRGRDARRVTLDRPLTVGSGEDADLLLCDRAVSARHCRFEPGESGLRVRDLGSRNGTFVEGVRVGLARLFPGSRLRLGRTDLRVVACGSPGDARADGLIAESSAMQEVLLRVERAARVRWPVLITGESGAGKEGVARALHARGPRPDAPFVAVNAGGMPATLIESELFGHEKGAFTGAERERRGVFEQAHGGTLFLDEIGELPIELQARLLRVLETYRVRRVGGEKDIPVEIRLVCATHRDLREMVELGCLREDLYYRLAGDVIEVPPLRDRPRDLAALAEHFLREASGEVGPKRFATCALERLGVHSWPGNARELRNVVRCAALHCASAWIAREHVDEALQLVGGRSTSPGETTFATVLAQYKGNLTAAARAMGVPRSTFRDRLRAQQRELQTG